MHNVLHMLQSTEAAAAQSSFGEDFLVLAHPNGSTAVTQLRLLYFSFPAEELCIVEKLYASKSSLHSEMRRLHTFGLECLLACFHAQCSSFSHFPFGVVFRNFPFPEKQQYFGLRKQTDGENLERIKRNNMIHRVSSVDRVSNGRIKESFIVYCRSDCYLRLIKHKFICDPTKQQHMKLGKTFMLRMVGVERKTTSSLRHISWCNEKI